MRYPKCAMRLKTQRWRARVRPRWGPYGFRAPGALTSAANERGFAGVQARGGLAEIGPGAGLDPHEVAAQGHPVEVLPENFRFTIEYRQPDAPDQLHQFAIITAGAGVDEPRQLLGDGGSAGDDAAVAQVGGRGPDDSQGVEARMLPEALVLRGHEGRGDQGGHRSFRQDNQLASLGLGHQAQNAAGPVQHQGAGPEFHNLRVQAGDGRQVPGQSGQNQQGRAQAPGPAA